MAMTLTLVCHASTAALRNAVFPTDEAVDAFGERDCARVKGALPRGPVLIAPELRARQTAELLGLAGDIEPALRDADYGIWTGKALADLSAEDLAQWLSDPDAAPHGGESISASLRRVADWLDRQAKTNGRVVVVTHPVILRAAIVHALGASAAAFQSIDVGPLSAAVFSFSNRWRLRSFAPLAEPPAD
jgi:broad specificity phosphatase PhoE